MAGTAVAARTSIAAAHWEGSDPWPWPDPPTEAPARPTSWRRADLTAIVVDGAAYSFMVGVGETYLPAFALAMGLGELAAGLIATLPILFGGLLQLITPWAIHWLRSHRRWVVFGAAIQACCFVPLMASAAHGTVGVIASFAIVSLYWGAGQATNPAWSAWIGDVVPKSIRARYFARRTRAMQAAVLAGFLAGGLTLQVFTAVDKTRLGFAFLFLLAAASRFVSVAFLASQNEPNRPAAARLSMGGLIAIVQKYGRRRVLLYMLCVQTAAQIAGPFFSPFMLGQLQFSYMTFMLVTATALAAKVVALLLWGPLVHRIGSRKLLILGGVAIIPISSLWLISRSLPFLLGVQALSGFVWAAYELAMLLSFFDAIEPEERATVLTAFNLANAAAIAVGSIIGGAVIRIVGETPVAYFTVFALSSVARALALFALPRLQPSASESIASRSPRADSGRDGDPSVLRLDSPVGTERETMGSDRIDGVGSAHPGDGSKRICRRTSLAGAGR